MTITNTKRLIRHQGNGVATSFPYDFLILEEADVEVLVYDETAGTVTEINSSAFTITGVGEEAGGSIEYPLVGDPLASTQWIIVKRTVPYSQESDINSQGGFFPNVIERQLDEIVMQTQQLAEEQSRMPKLLEGDTFTNKLPRKATLADRTMAFDENGEPIAGPTATAVENAQANATAAATSAAAAAASETAAASSATAAATSETAAETAQTGAETALDDFTDLYLGAKAADPTLDNDGDALQLGAMYFNTTAGQMRTWDGTQWTAAVSGDGVADTGGFVGDGLETNFNIGHAVAAAQLLWVEDGIPQRPGVDFTMNGPEVVRAEAPADGAAIFWALMSGIGEKGDPGSSDVVGTSTTSLLIGTGSKVFTVAEANRGWGVGARLRASSAANPTLNRMEGVVTAYDGVSSLTLEIDTIAGSGTFADWVINLAGGAAAGGGVSGPASSTADNLAAFADASGNLLKDSGQSFATLGIGTTAALDPPNDDLNDAIIGGIVRADTAANRPTGAGSWLVLTMPRSSTVSVQIAFERHNLEAAYFRIQHSVDGWKPWIPLSAKGAILQEVIATSSVNDSTVSASFSNTSLSAAITPIMPNSVIEATAILPFVDALLVSGSSDVRAGEFKLRNSTDGVDGPRTAFGRFLTVNSSASAISRAGLTLIERFTVNSLVSRTINVQFASALATNLQVRLVGGSAKATLILREIRQ